MFLQYWNSLFDHVQREEISYAPKLTNKLLTNKEKQLGRMQTLICTYMSLSHPSHLEIPHNKLMV